MDLPDLNFFEHWWKLLIAAGVAITAAGAAAGNNGLILVGLGMVCVGFGEFINHPYQERLDPYLRFKIRGHARRPSPVGWLLDGLGLLLAAIGLVRLMLAT